MRIPCSCAASGGPDAKGTGALISCVIDKENCQPGVRFKPKIRSVTPFVSIMERIGRRPREARRLGKKSWLILPPIANFVSNRTQMNMTSVQALRPNLWHLRQEEVRVLLNYINIHLLAQACSEP